jgi:hypothetical protein
MFSSGQLLFALCFFVAFVVIIFLSYRKDKKRQGAYFNGSYKILISFLIALSLLFAIKYLTRP